MSTAARIESKCKEYGCLLLVGESTYDKTEDDFFYLKVDELAVKGKSVGIRIYTVLSEMDWAFKNTNWFVPFNNNMRRCMGIIKDSSLTMRLEYVMI